MAYVDRGIRPAREVVRLAAAGQLEHGGLLLEGFDVAESTVRSLGRQLGLRRRGEVNSALAKAPARDAHEALRRRLVTIADHHLAAIERDQKRRRGRVENPDELRQMARAVREIVALTPNGAPSSAPPVVVPENPTGAVAQGGALLRAFRATSSEPDETTAEDSPATEAAMAARLRDAVKRDFPEVDDARRRPRQRRLEPRLMPVAPS